MSRPRPIDQTHDAKLRSWVPGANGHPEFPIQNLPFGRFLRTADPAAPADLGVAIGDQVLSVTAAADAGVLPGLASDAVDIWDAEGSGAFLQIGPEAWTRATRGLPRRAIAVPACDRAPLPKRSTYFSSTSPWRPGRSSYTSSR